MYSRINSKNVRGIKMNKGTFRNVLYIILGFMIFSAILSLFFRILPFLLLGGGIIYLLIKIKGYFRKEKIKDEYYSYKSESNSSDEVYEDDYIDTSEAIDVDYEDVDE